MVLWLIGLGLYDEKDITLRCAFAWLAAFISVLAESRAGSRPGTVAEGSGRFRDEQQAQHSHQGRQPPRYPGSQTQLLASTRRNRVAKSPLRACRGLEAVKKCSRVYLEAYTSILLCEKKKLVSSVNAAAEAPSQGATHSVRTVRKPRSLCFQARTAKPLSKASGRTRAHMCVLHAGGSVWQGGSSSRQRDG